MRGWPTEFEGTKAEILGGVNASTQTDAAGRKLTKDVTTGWSGPTGQRRLLGNVLTLQGLTDVGACRTDTFALAMAVTHGGGSAGVSILVSRNAEGRWVNAVDLNVGGKASFVRGPWKAGYPLGTYGVDSARPSGVGGRRSRRAVCPGPSLDSAVTRTRVVLVEPRGRHSWSHQ